MDWEGELKATIYNFQVDKKGISDNGEDNVEYRVRKHNIHVNERLARMPTIGGYYCRDFREDVDKETGERVDRRLPCRTLFRVNALDKGIITGIITIPYDVAIKDEFHKKQLKDFYAFTDKTFLKYARCETCMTHDACYDYVREKEEYEEPTIIYV